MLYARHLAAPVLLLAIALAGCTTAPQQQPTSASAKLQAEVPTLKVTVDCGGCTVRSDIPLRIVANYNIAASKAGVKVSPDKVAYAAIKSYSERNDGARFLAGAFAGKDEIKLSLTTPDNRHLEVEDYFRNAFQGMDDLLESIGTRVLLAMRQ